MSFGKRSLLCLLIIIAAFFSQATITELQPLDFGKVAITKNDASGSISIDESGNTQVSGGFAILEQGQHAIYELSDLPTSRTLTIDVDIINSTMIPDLSSEETFELSIIRNSNTVFTGDSGTAILSFGGQITTSGSGSNRFTDTDYNSTIQITINL
ncbi:DUF4402 domain-containing protein [Glaciecola sp. KUL10]|uniref:DUF4402 domain-containing protein n=1 Tax=Glaciecola sp. (strain KUL10) TaxID=2161813 RepID=UPI000D78B6CB|nr:DUF4402 domain-containing protein [Glaciecola sp. KUL10]GBL03997.1 hypothetical protein KUL10_12990 [Glaciecola sp. KUL10]